jgi:hypothetical protein
MRLLWCLVCLTPTEERREPHLLTFNTASSVQNCIDSFIIYVMLQGNKGYFGYCRALFDFVLLFIVTRLIISSRESFWPLEINAGFNQENVPEFLMHRRGGYVPLSPLFTLLFCAAPKDSRNCIFAVLGLPHELGSRTDMMPVK